MSRHRSAATRAEVEKLFRSDEEREVRERLKKEISGSKRTCMEAMSALVLANHKGEKMDIIADMLKRSSKFGSVTDKQHEYAASIITKSHMDHLLDIMARAEAGEDTVEMAGDGAGGEARAEADRDVGDGAQPQFRHLLTGAQKLLNERKMSEQLGSVACWVR